MARNRKYKTAAIRFGPALKALLLCLLIGGSGVGYVWQKNQIYQLGQQRRQREMRLGLLQEQNAKLSRQLQTMRLPQSLERRIQELGLGLGPPQLSQVLLLPEPVAEPAGPGSSPNSAAPDGHTAILTMNR